MKKKILFLIIFAVLVGIAGVSVKKIKEIDSRAINFSRFKTAVYAEHIKKRTIRSIRSYVGRCFSEAKFSVSSQVLQQVSQINVSEGDVVKSGDVLAELDSRSITENIRTAAAKIKSLEIAVQSQKIMINSASENFNYWKKNRERNKRLLSEKAISQETYDKIELSYIKAENDNTAAQLVLRKLKADLESLQTTYEDLKIKKDLHVIRAPKDGVIAQRAVEFGDIAVIGKQLFLIESDSFFKVKFHFPVSDSRLIKKDLSVTLHFDSFSVEGYRISKIYPAVSDNMNITAEIYVKKSDLENIYIGEYLTVDVITEERRNVPSVSVNAVILSEHNAFVFEIKDGKLHKKKIMIGITDGKYREITSNMLENTQVATGSFLDIHKNYENEPVMVYGEIE